MYTNRKEGGGAGWQGDFVEELLVESWKRERRLIETPAEKGRRISHGRTRKNTEEAEAETRKNYLVRAGSVSDGLQGKEKKSIDASQNNINLS